MTDNFYGSGYVGRGFYAASYFPRLLVQILETEDGAVKGKMPTRAHPTDAGLDLYNVVDTVIPMQETVAVHTGVAIKVPEGYAGLIWDRSGHARSLRVTTVGGLIDPAYTGELLVLLRNEGFAPVEFKAGTKIAQLVIVPILIPEIVQVDAMPETDRGDKGFGSTNNG